MSSVPTTQPVVSVIVTTSDRADARVLDSLIAQSFRDFEVIVVNDGGPPLEAALSLLGKRLTVTYVRHAFARGVAAACNTGLRLARGYYVAYLQDGSIFQPSHLEVLVQSMRQGNHRAACGQVEPEQVGTTPALFSRDRLLEQDALTLLGHERSCLDEVGMFDEKLGASSSWDLLLRLANRYPIVQVPQITTGKTVAVAAAAVRASLAPGVTDDQARTVAQAKALLSLGDPAGATNILSSGLLHGTPSADFLLTMADCLLAQNNLASVHETLQHARKLHPANIDIAARLAMLTLASVPPAPGAHSEPATAPSSASFKVVATKDDPTPRGTRLVCVFINTFYPAFLATFRGQRPDLGSATYAAQKDALLGSFFGDSDFYSTGLRKAGWDAHDLVVNDPILAHTWAKETGFASAQPLEVAIEQIRRLRPQVVYLQDLGLATADFLSRIRPHTELIVGQIASPMPAQADVQNIDIIFTSFPHFARRLRQAGTTAYYQPLAFSERVLQGTPAGPRNRPLSFVGGLSPAHPAGTELLTRLAQTTNIEIWGYGAEALPFDSPIRARHRGEAWGQDMFRLLQESQITVNRHIGAAETYANNMRLFEATGCGALLITDHKDNLADLFEIGKEVVAYRSPEECEALIQYYQQHPEQAAQVARAGQQRTLRDHTYDARMRDTAAILARHIRRQRENQRFCNVDLGAISTGYKPMEAASVTPALRDAWKNESLPLRQRALVHRELTEMYKGRDVVPFKVLVDSLRPALACMPAAATSLLEIGCASGYYHEVLRYLLEQPLAYTGVDYSPAMIAMAKDYYPEATFTVADGAKLPYADASFDVVVSSCVLLHVPNYREHVRETARVAKDLVVVHRTPVRRRHGTQHRSKQGYGVDMVELQFNESELGEVLAASGLQIVSGIQYHGDDAADDYGVTYVCRKVA